MEALKSILLCAAASMVLAGCIRDEIMPCPPLSIEITVADKNWSNIAEVEAAGFAVAKDENLPFSEYVSTITYELKNIATGEIVSAEPAYSISHDGKSEILTFPESLPFGIYEFSVWGNLEPGTKSDGLSDTIVLHQDAKEEAREVYHYTAVLNYDYDKASYTAGLKRTVGCLLVDATNLPSRINFSKKEISGVMSQVSKGLEYSEPVSIFTELDWEDAKSNMRTMTCLGPSPSRNGTEVTVRFYDMDSSCSSSPYEVSADPVDVTVERNMLTVLKYDYDGDGFHISVLVNDKWETLHGMIVD